MTEEQSKILVVEDDPDLLEILEFNLSKEDYAVATAKDGIEALQKALELRPDLMVLDLMLPRLTGLQVCQRLRTRPETSQILILMLTARGEEMDRIIGFEMGADDYMVKPFSVRELGLRVQAMLRRRQQPSEGVIVAGALVLDTGRHEVRIHGETVLLTPLEFKLLAYLLRAPGQIRTREELLDHVWGYSSDVNSRTVDTHIKRMREKLGSVSAQIQTVRSLGYRWSDQNR